MPTYSEITLFRDKKQYRLFIALFLSTLFSFLLVGLRLWRVPFDWSLIHSFRDLKFYRGIDGTYLFLVWNLFLAWVPYWIALSLDLLNRVIRPSNWSAGALLIAWLLFFPNAPYIVTDLLHLKVHEHVPFWFDAMLFLSFAWTGLLLGYCSVFEIERFLEERLSKTQTHRVLIASLGLAGLGVFMGRFQRWNSWDILHHPWAVVRSECAIFLNPWNHLGSLAVVMVISGFLIVGYWTLTALKTA